MCKNFKKSKKAKKPDNKKSKISYQEFKRIVSGLTDEELNLVGDWLLNRQQKT